MNDPERVVLRGASFHKRALVAGMIVGAAGAGLGWFVFNEVIMMLFFGGW